MTTNPLPTTAVWYAEEMDWAIFPLAPRSKIPTKGSKGFKDATGDPQTIEKRWKASPCSNIGCATGDASGLLVIDVDDPESFKVLCRGREIPLSARQTTSPGRM
ncbi:MAG: bifunctional DNA primase/polymerase, partial [Planctomycetota bacterium]